jgi:hypothetical protein
MGFLQEFDDREAGCCARSALAEEQLRLTLSNAVYGIHDARSNEFANPPCPTVAAKPSCAATPVVAQWSLRRQDAGNILFWLQKP